jgi:superfamily II DNA/RNA helicase
MVNILTPLQQRSLVKLGIDSLTPMQEASLFAAREPQDVILLSPTGTGKTLAYLLPLLETFTPEAGVQVLVVVPSRELAQQIVAVFTDMATDWRAMAVYGGRPAMDEHRSMHGVNPSLIVGTPGRLNDHLAKGNINASTVHTLVIDEFDKCLELGFQEEMHTLLTALPALKRRRLMSATDCAELPEFVALQRYVKLDYLTAPLPVTAVNVTNDADVVQDEVRKVKCHVVQSPEKDKLVTLYRLLCTFGGAQAIVFCNYREAVERVGKYLTEQRFVHADYHGGLEQDLRERALYRFRSGSANVLVSTDLASRGLDIPDVRHIVHYHLPVSEEACIHRTGRTARWDADGDSWFVLGPEEMLPDYVDDAEPFDLPLHPGRPTLPEWETLYIGKGKKDRLSKSDIVGFLCKKGKLTATDISRIDVHEYYAFVAVRRHHIRSLLARVAGEKIKGMRTIIEIAR